MDKLTAQDASKNHFIDRTVGILFDKLEEARGKHSGLKPGEAPARGSEEAKKIAKRTRFERGAAQEGAKNPELATSRLRIVATGKHPDGAPAGLEDKRQMGRIVARTGKVAKRSGEGPVSRADAGVRSRKENRRRNDASTEVLGNKIEESLINEALLFCERNNIDVDSLNEEQINEIFGFVRAAASGLANAGRMVKNAGALKVNKIKQGIAKGSAYKKLKALKKAKSYARSRKQALGVAQDKINKGPAGFKGFIHNVKNAYEVGKQGSKLAGANKNVEKRTAKFDKASGKLQKAKDRTVSSRSRLISQGTGRSNYKLNTGSQEEQEKQEESINNFIERTIGIMFDRLEEVKAQNVFSAAVGQERRKGNPGPEISKTGAADRTIYLRNKEGRPRGSVNIYSPNDPHKPKTPSGKNAGAMITRYRNRGPKKGEIRSRPIPE